MSYENSTSTELKQALSPFVLRLLDEMKGTIKTLEKDVAELKAAKPAEPTPKPAKPTEGEWRYEDGAVLVGHDVIGSVYWSEGNPSDSERDANGRLFAASKRMAELLREVRRGHITNADRALTYNRIDAILKEIDGQ